MEWTLKDVNSTQHSSTVQRPLTACAFVIVILFQKALQVTSIANRVREMFIFLEPFEFLANVIPTDIFVPLLLTRISSNNLNRSIKNFKKESALIHCYHLTLDSIQFFCICPNNTFYYKTSQSRSIFCVGSSGFFSLLQSS